MSNQRTKERGSLLLQAVFLVALMTVSAASVLPVMGSALREQMATETLAKLHKIEVALHAYYRDLQVIPSSLSNLIYAPQGSANWRGPYLTQVPSSIDRDELSFDVDAWRTPVALIQVDSWTIRLVSWGENRLDDNGLGDDLVVECSLHEDAWELTRQEIADLNSAITAYNQNISPPDLPGQWPDLLVALQDSGYLPNQEHYSLRLALDAWGQPYVPDGTPAGSVSTLGPPQP